MAAITRRAGWAGLSSASTLAPMLETVCAVAVAVQHDHVHRGFRISGPQPLAPEFLNPDGKGMLAPTTIFNTAVSFFTNTNLQHYAGEQHLSYFSQLSTILWNMFVSASVGFCALVAIIRGLRGDQHMGNYYVDMWRVVVYVFLPAGLIMGVLLIQAGVPMTLAGAAEAATLEPGAMGNRKGPGSPAKDCSRPGGGHHSHQAPGHQRRRLLRRQLGAPVRESQRLEQFPDVYQHFDLAVFAHHHVRQDVE